MLAREQRPQRESATTNVPLTRSSKTCSPCCITKITYCWWSVLASAWVFSMHFWPCWTRSSNLSATRKWLFFVVFVIFVVFVVFFCSRKLIWPSQSASLVLKWCSYASMPIVVLLSASLSSYHTAMTMRVLLARSLLCSALSAQDPLVRGTLCNVMYIVFKKVWLHTTAVIVCIIL